ncbi:conserved hypothetical protein [Bosea sp. 62]|uniref:hypothetical protein n=1 Tax=unclassified Bosea (in: a-proteobacteria) TaxID=2653178 RepID=UPI001255509D|nr:MULTISPECIES: hypothetical protein [unclassified Bosea (in: a-proteobacteria)]CAD5254153.1 conserved hypothetical protein [Bosea sp. 7B]CAD5276961.1 conserved hypothetical protein [Bosea sp. 21B]CAD5278063.1 conserved hypothetical protein [Bosea sp. 46]VVT59823.1 conserved hypothetical protein [Bosea sp. EC-HK365B]VXB44781.1 conserved hypothetical protein [Bosea sp. 62]
MRTVTYWIPAATLAEAGVVARAVHRRAVPRMPWHGDETACQRRADECNALLGARPVKPFAIVIEERTVDDGRIVNVWAGDRIGEIAAAIVLFAMIPLVGIASFYEVMA